MRIFFMCGWFHLTSLPILCLIPFPGLLFARPTRPLAAHQERRPQVLRHLCSLHPILTSHEPSQNQIQGETAKSEKIVLHLIGNRLNNRLFLPTLVLTLAREVFDHDLLANVPLPLGWGGFVKMS